MKEEKEVSQKTYCYEIQNIQNGKIYIGWRISNDPEKDIGIKYFSSSTDIDFMEDQSRNPNNYTYNVLSIFNTKKEAVSEESRLLTEVDAQHNPMYYNLSNGCNWYYDATGSQWMTNNIIDIKITHHNTQRLTELIEKGFERGRSFSGLGHPTKGKTPVHKTIEETNKTFCRMVFDFEVDKYISMGYVKGTGRVGNKYPAFFGNKQKWFKNVNERKTFITENPKWKNGQTKRDNFDTDNKVFVYDLTTNKKVTINTETYKGKKWKRYISIGSDEQSRSYGKVLNEYNDVIFKGFYGESKEVLSSKIPIHGFTTIKKWSNCYDYLLSINKADSVKLRWEETQTWEERLKETERQKNMRRCKSTEIKQIRKSFLKEQENICPVCTRKIKPGEENLDHCHTSGQLRGVLCKTCNSNIEGGFRSKWKRSGLSDIIAFEELLLNLYNYLSKDAYPILHPTHKRENNKLMKSSYNTLTKEVRQANEYLTKKIRIPDFPKSGRMTKRLKELYEQMGIEPRYYTK